jgi:NAD(P)-dependent dehydrogenase (short-subunit alcohol dehydrogenase family)
MKQLVGQSQKWKVLLGARDTVGTPKAYDALGYDRARQSVSVLPLELSDLRTVKLFAQQTLNRLGQDKIDYLLLNAGVTQAPDEPGVHGVKWCPSYVVNHLCKRGNLFWTV